MKPTSAIVALSLLCGASALATPPATNVSEVVFKSSDNRVNIKGYLFQPTTKSNVPRPAIVMMAGRTGAYKSGATVFDAANLASRHKAWGQFWASRGYFALMVDDFGSLGMPSGFAHETAGQRPPQFNEVWARPLYANGALNYLRGRKDVNPARIGAMGFSNGASAVLATVGTGSTGLLKQVGFRAVVAMYPGCGLEGKYSKTGYVPYAAVQIHMGTADQEVSPEVCKGLVNRSRQLGGPISLTLYNGADHGFDTPTADKQNKPANAAAKASAEKSIEAFFAQMR